MSLPQLTWLISLFHSLPVWVTYPLILVNTVVVITLFNAAVRKYKYPEKTFNNALISVLLTPLRVLQLGINSCLFADSLSHSFIYSFTYLFIYSLVITLKGPYSEGEITIEKCMKWAMKKTKLDDFGDKNNQFLVNYQYVTERYHYRY